MFDFSKITETISGLLPGNLQQLPMDGAGITELLANAGVAPALLDGLSQDEAFALLQQHGIDPSLLDLGQLSEVLQNANVSGNLTDMAQSWLGSRGS